MPDFDFFSVPSSSGGIKLPVCLVLDISGSMSDTLDGKRGSFSKIDQLNYNIDKLFDTIINDNNAKMMSDICLIGCGGEKPKIICGYSNVENVHFKHQTASGRTPLGASVDMALEMLRKRRQYYRDNGIEHFKPILMIMSDGLPTEPEYIYESAAKRCSEMVEKEGLKVLPIAIGDMAALDILDLFSPKVKAKAITNMDVFKQLFEMLSTSISRSDNTVFDWLNEQL